MQTLTLTIAAIAVAVSMLQAPRRVTNLDGEFVDALQSAPGIRATVLIFLRTDCPVANQAAPEIERVRAQYSGRGVRVWLVYVDPTQTAEQIRGHLQAYGLGAPAIRDHDHELVRFTGVRVTPESAVYTHEGTTPRLVYRGRLDDRVVELGEKKPRATTFDLRRAIATVLDVGGGALVTTRAVGCEIADLR